MLGSKIPGIIHPQKRLDLSKQKVLFRKTNIKEVTGFRFKTIPSMEGQQSVLKGKIN